jgi:hypothetical protein
LRDIEGNWFSNVHIAHIVAHSSDGPRFNEAISPAERKRFHNLLLLCKPHHSLVDSKEHEKTYTVTVLKGWKEAREGNNTNLLSDLHEDDVQGMLINAVTAAKKEILAAIDTLSDDHTEVKALLMKLMDESFSRPYLDANALSTLEYSARLLGPLEENSLTLRGAAELLGPLETNASTLMGAAETLDGLTGNANALAAAAAALENHAWEIQQLEHATKNLSPEQIEQTIQRLENWAPSGSGSIDLRSIKTLTDRVNQIHDAVSTVRNASVSDRFFNDDIKKGMIAGFGLAVLLAIAIVVIMLQAHK